jgi:hypothetical protein
MASAAVAVQDNNRFMGIGDNKGGGQETTTQNRIFLLN